MPKLNRSRVQSTFVFNHILVHTQYLLSRHVLSLTFLFASILGKNRPRCNTWQVPSAEVRFLPLCAYHLVSRHGPRATVHILRQSTSSTTIHFFTYSISIDRPSLTEMRVIMTVSEAGRDGIANDGGTRSHKFAKDGELSYLAQHPTSVFASSVQMAHQLQTCWPIRLPFLSSSITIS